MQQAAMFPDLLCLAVMVAAAAAVVVAVLARQRLAADLAATRELNVRLEGQLAVEQVRVSRVPDLEQTVAEHVRLTDALRTAAASADRDCATAKGELSRVEAALHDVQARLAEAEGALAAARTEREGFKTELATLQETLGKERQHAAEKLQLLLDAKETMAKEFGLLANDVMARHGESFSKQNKEQIDLLLQPMRDKLAEFQQGLQTAHTESAKERATLGEQIRGLSEASVRMTTETTNLTRALKGQAQTQGAWGEMILESVLERSGLRKGEEYVTQASGSTEDGQRLRPDVIVTLPGDQRRIVIDAKVSLVAFDGHVNAATDDERGVHLRRHLELHARAYQDAGEQGLPRCGEQPPRLRRHVRADRGRPRGGVERGSQPDQGRGRQQRRHRDADHADDRAADGRERLAGGAPEQERREDRGPRWQALRQVRRLRCGHARAGGQARTGRRTPTRAR